MKHSRKSHFKGLQTKIAECFADKTVGSITSRCSGNEPTLGKAGPEGAGEIEPNKTVSVKKFSYVEI